MTRCSGARRLTTADRLAPASRDDDGAVAGDRRRAPGRTQASALRRPRATAVGKARLRGDEDRARGWVVFGLRDEVGRNPLRPAAVGAARRSRSGRRADRSGSRARRAPWPPRPTRCPGPTILSTRAIDFGAVRERADGLRAADRAELRHADFERGGQHDRRRPRAHDDDVASRPRRAPARPSSRASTAADIGRPARSSRRARAAARAVRFGGRGRQRHDKRPGHLLGARRLARLSMATRSARRTSGGVARPAASRQFGRDTGRRAHALRP